MQPAVLKALHWNLLSVVPHARGVVENLFSTASGPVSTVLRSRSAPLIRSAVAWVQLRAKMDFIS